MDLGVIFWVIFLRRVENINSSSVQAPVKEIRLRFTAMLFGMVLCLAIAVGLPYGEFIIKGTSLVISS